MVRVRVQGTGDAESGGAEADVVLLALSDLLQTLLTPLFKLTLAILVFLLKIQTMNKKIVLILSRIQTEGVPAP